MGFGRSYTMEEKRVRHEIANVMRKQRYHRKMWLDLDVQRGALIHLLNGKYKPRKL